MENQNSENQFGDDVSRYLEFKLGEEFYAVPLLMVREVIPVPETTPIPKAPPHFNGIMNLRGQVISIIDLRKKLNVKPSEGEGEEAVIIVAIGELSIGIVVDAVHRVLGLTKKQIAEVPQIESQVSTKFIQGVFQREESLTMLLDVAGLLDVKDLAAIDNSPAKAA